jgi:hypothetical protein
VNLAAPLLADAAALERGSRSASCTVDTDGDGLLDLVEIAAGLNPSSVDSKSDNVFDDERNRDGIAISNWRDVADLSGPGRHRTDSHVLHIALTSRSLAPTPEDRYSHID